MSVDPGLPFSMINASRDTSPLKRQVSPLRGEALTIPSVSALGVVSQAGRDFIASQRK